MFVCVFRIFPLGEAEGLLVCLCVCFFEHFFLSVSFVDRHSLFQNTYVHTCQVPGIIHHAHRARGIIYMSTGVGENVLGDGPCQKDWVDG